MKAWSAPIILSFVLIGVAYYATVLNLSPVALGPGETISGIKRWPGTWNEDTIRVQAGEDLGEHTTVVAVLFIARPRHHEAARVVAADVR